MDAEVALLCIIFARVIRMAGNIICFEPSITGAAPRYERGDWGASDNNF